jgi:endoglucanase
MPAARTTRFSVISALQELAEADGPPGREEPLRRLAARHLHPSMRHVRVSPLGSLYAERPSARGTRLMLTASLDEVGFIVSHVDRAGIAWLHPSGRIDPDSCTGAEIRFQGGIRATLGVIPSANGDGAPPRMLADLGASEREVPLRIGTMGVFATPSQSERTTIDGKALDSRLGAAIALDVTRRTTRSANTLVLALTTLGQLGNRAARAAALDLAPTAAITLGAYAVADKRVLGATDVRLGKGPVILLRSEQFVADLRLVEELQQAAARARIPIQLAVAEEDTTGAAAVQASLEGISTAALLVPCKGVGSPRQQIERRDLEAAVELLVKLVSRPLNL